RAGGTGATQRAPPPPPPAPPPAAGPPRRDRAPRPAAVRALRPDHRLPDRALAPGRGCRLRRVAGHEQRLAGDGDGPRGYTRTAREPARLPAVPPHAIVEPGRHQALRARPRGAQPAPRPHWRQLVPRPRGGRGATQRASRDRAPGGRAVAVRDPARAVPRLRRRYVAGV